jgi:hypothetical protein
VTLHRAFEFRFKADLHGLAGIEISRAARAKLRSGEIDNEWKDTIGRGEADGLRIAICRTNTKNEWTLIALPVGGDGYDREEAAALRREVVAALRVNAEEFRELAPELGPGGSGVE